MNPIAAIAANAPMIVTGTVVAGTRVIRQSCRNTTITTSTSKPRLEQRVVHLVDRLLHERRRVERNRPLQTLRKVPGDLGHLRPHARRRVQGVRFGELIDRDPARHPLVHLEELAVGLGAELHAPHVLQPRDLASRALHDDVGELLRPGQVAAEVDRQLERLARARGRSADLAGRDVGVLRLDRGDHVRRHERALEHLLGIQPDPHAVLADAEDRHVAHPRQARELVAQLQRREVREIEGVVLVALRGQRHDLQDRRRLLLRDDPLLLDGFRELRERGRDAVLHQHLGQIEVGADREGHDERVPAVVRRRRLHVEHALDAVDLLLDRQPHRLDQSLRVRPGVVGRHLDGRRRDRRILRDRQHEERHRPEQDRHERDHVREDRTLDEKLG